VIKVTTSNINGVSTHASSILRVKKAEETKSDSGKKTIDDVLEELREMMPGWVISSSTADWGEGFRNIQIDRDILQSMADDPRQMEKYKNLILDLKNSVPDLEKWTEDNPGKTLIFELTLDSKGKAAMSIVETLMGVEKRTAFGLPDDRTLWAELIRKKFDELGQGQIEDVNGNRSWIA